MRTHTVLPTPSEAESLRRKGYTVGKKIGQGSYCTVHAAEYHPEDHDHTGTSTKIKLAVKVFDKESAPQDCNDKFFPREIEIMQRLDNKHLIQVHSILERGPRTFIFMRFAENGDLLDHIRSKGAIPEKQARLWFGQLVEGLQYLHGMNVCHRDLKCENVLLTKMWNVKIADFGFARFTVDNDGHHVKSDTYCGSAAYAAPEVVSGTPYNPKVSDVWSMGIILYIMVNNTMPFDDGNLKKLLKDQLARKWAFRAKYRDVLSPQLKSLVNQILEPDVGQRITLHSVATNEWLSAGKDQSHTTKS